MIESLFILLVLLSFAVGYGMARCFSLEKTVREKFNHFVDGINEQLPPIITGVQKFSKRIEDLENQLSTMNSVVQDLEARNNLVRSIK